MANKWFYIKSEPNLYTVGYEDSFGKWHTDSDWDSKKEAGDRVHSLNGGSDKELLEALEGILDLADYGYSAHCAAGRTPKELNYHMSRLTKAKAAIKKAKGE